MWDFKRSAVNQTCTNLNLNACGSAAGCGRSPYKSMSLSKSLSHLPHRSNPVKVIKLSCQSVWATQFNLFFPTHTLNLLRRCLAVKSPGILFDLRNVGHKHNQGIDSAKWIVSPLLKFKREINNLHLYQLVVSTHLKNISEIGSFPQVRVKIKNIWNHHPV